MADSLLLAGTSIPTFEEIQNMKVTALRNKLKAFGLSISGNKNELIERLTEACYPSKGQDSFETSQLGFDESQISELDDVADDGSTVEDENALLDHDQFSSYISSSLEDDSKVLNSTENKISAVSNSVIMPPKKRSLIKMAEEAPVEKKISLNRTNVSIIDFKIKKEPKPEVTITAAESEMEKNKISLKKMSAADRMAMRAKRFNVVSSTTPSVTSTKSSINRNSKQSILSSSTAPDIDVLKKRAERFGQSVSTVMKQIEQKEKLLKRKSKFGANLGAFAVSGLGDQDKKRQRAERFGML